MAEEYKIIRITTNTAGGITDAAREDVVSTAVTFTVSGLTVSQDLNVDGQFIANGSNSFGVISASTIYSGSTNLYDIFLTTADGNDITRVQPGTNINTGGTDNFPIINLENNIVLTSVNATSVSGGTIYSGSTDLYDIFITSADGNDITRVQPGTNTTTGGTDNFPTVNLVDSPSINGLTASGTSNFTGTIQSGGTDLYNIFLTTADGNDITRVQPGTNINTGGTANNPIVSVVDSPSFNNLTVSGNTLLSGLTNVYGDTVASAAIQPGINNTYDLGAPSFRWREIFTINIDVNNFISTNSLYAGFEIESPSISGTSVSATTLYSGSTDVSDLFQDWTLQTDFDAHTGDTSNPHSVTAAQAGAYSTTQADNLYNTKADLSGDTFTGQVIAPSFSATTVSGGTIYSGSTDLYSIFLTTADGNDIVRVQPGTNTTTGGTDNFPSVSLVDSPSINGLTASGTSNFTGVIQSGGTDLYSIFATDTTSDVTRVQPGTNITTGGTDNFPTVNLADDVLTNSVSAVTISGGTIYGDGSNLTGIAWDGTEVITVGNDVVNGDLLYLDADAVYRKASNTGETTSSTELRVSTETIASGATGIGLIQGKFTTTGLTSGDKYWLGTDGSYTNVQPTGDGNIVRYIGTALNTTTLEFMPDETYIEITTGSGVNVSTQPSLVNVTSNYTILGTDYTVNVTTTGDTTQTLPTAVGVQGQVYNIKNSDTTATSTITLTTTASQTIDGYSAVTYSFPDNITVQSDGSNWIII